MRIRVVLLAVLALVAAGAVAVALVRPQGSEPAVATTEGVPVRVGTGPEPEAVLLAHVFAELLRAEGIAAEVQQFGRRVDARQAIELGEVDVMPSYSGAVWVDELGLADPPGDPAASYERVREEDERQGLRWLEPSQVNATFAFAVAGIPSLDATMDDVGDLARLNTEPERRLCVDAEFASRPDGLERIARIYAIGESVLRAQILDAPPQVVPAAVSSGDCIAGLTTTTDGAAWVRGLRPLADPLRTFPAFVVAPVVTDTIAQQQPEVVAALAPFRTTTNALLARWNGQVTLGVPTPLVAVEAAARLRG